MNAMNISSMVLLRIVNGIKEADVETFEIFLLRPFVEPNFYLFRQSCLFYFVAENQARIQGARTQSPNSGPWEAKHSNLKVTCLSGSKLEFSLHNSMRIS